MDGDEQTSARWAIGATRPTLMSLMQSGDEIALPVQTSPTGSPEMYRGTIVELVDDEPNRHINMTVRFPLLGVTATNPVKPGELVHRLTAIDESRNPVFVPAVDLWKWEGMWFHDPDGARVRLIRAQRGPHPTDGREILALVVEDEQQRRRPIPMEMSGGLFCEWADD